MGSVIFKLVKSSSKSEFKVCDGASKLFNLFLLKNFLNKRLK